MNRRFATAAAHERSRIKLSQQQQHQELVAVASPKKRKLVKRADRPNVVAHTGSTSSSSDVVYEETQIIHLRAPRDKDQKDGMRGYNDDEFIVSDNVKVAHYDKDYENEVSEEDMLTTAKREKVNAEIARDAYNQAQKLENIRTSFCMNAAINQMRVPIVDMEKAIANILLDRGSIDTFISKYDASLLGGTLTAFRSTVNRKTIEACLVQGIWKLETFNYRVQETCVLCSLERESCKALLITKLGYAVGHVGDDCATRWSLLDRIYALRSEILSHYGCGNENNLAAHYYTRILELQETCIRKLQELQNRFKTQHEEKNTD